jgi:hypothetical protein
MTIGCCLERRITLEQTAIKPKDQLDLLNLLEQSRTSEIRECGVDAVEVEGVGGDEFPTCVAEIVGSDVGGDGVTG